MATDPLTQYEAVVAEIIAISPSTPGKWFSLPCLKSNGKVFAGFWKQEEAMVFKLPTAARVEALALVGACLFDPSGGRPMKEWVQVPAAHAAQWSSLAHQALGYIQAL